MLKFEISVKRCDKMHTKLSNQFKFLSKALKHHNSHDNGQCSQQNTKPLIL